MVSFVIYDLTFLALFCLFVIIFLYKRRDKLKRELGIAFLYKTQVGINFMDNVAKKYKKILKPLQYVILVSGFVLMSAVLWLLAETSYIYIKNFSEIFKVIKAPPIAPLIPYFPELWI